MAFITYSDKNKHGRVETSESGSKVKEEEGKHRTLNLRNLVLIPKPASDKSSTDSIVGVSISSSTTTKRGFLSLISKAKLSISGIDEPNFLLGVRNFFDFPLQNSQLQNALMEPRAYQPKLEDEILEIQTLQKYNERRMSTQKSHKCTSRFSSP